MFGVYLFNLIIMYVILQIVTYKMIHLNLPPYIFFNSNAIQN
jgi:hypothetical protein